MVAPAEISSLSTLQPFTCLRPPTESVLFSLRLSVTRSNTVTHCSCHSVQHAQESGSFPRSLYSFKLLVETSGAMYKADSDFCYVISWFFENLPHGTFHRDFRKNKDKGLALIDRGQRPKVPDRISDQDRCQFKFQMELLSKAGAAYIHTV